MRSSSSPMTRGAPAVSISLPPPSSTSEPSRQTSWCAAAAAGRRRPARASSAATAAARRSRSARRVRRSAGTRRCTLRCSGGWSRPEGARGASSAGTRDRLERGAVDEPAARPAGAWRRRRSSRPGPRCAPAQPAGAALRSRADHDSPASAAFSMRTTRSPRGPRRAARGGTRRRRTGEVPLWTPCETRSVTWPAPVFRRPIWRSGARIPARRGRRARRAPRARTAAAARRRRASAGCRRSRRRR